jgi:hypothetical protein
MLMRELSTDFEMLMRVAAAMLPPLSMTWKKAQTSP